MDNDIDGDGEGGGGLAPELSVLSDDELTFGYDATVAAVRRAEWQRLALAAEIDRRRMYLTDGTASLRAWICVRTGEGDRAAAHQARLAMTLPDYPLLSEALRDGRVSVDHVRWLLMLADLTGATDDELVASGQRHTVPQLETACRAAKRLRRRAEQDGHDRRYVRWWCDDNGTFHLRGQLHGADGLTVTNVLSAMAEAGQQPDPLTGVHVPFDARCADALVEVCTGSPVAPSERAVVVIHAPLAALRPNPPDAGTDIAGDNPDPGPDGPAGVPVTWDGTVISNDTLRRILCDSRLRATVDDPDGRCIGIGRRSRVIPDWLAEQVRWRDQHCRFPGCERTLWLHGHHVSHWADGGPTDLANIALLCTRHHRSVHEGDWRVGGCPDGALTFTAPTGRTHVTHPALHPDSAKPRPRTTHKERRSAGPTHPNGP